MLKSNSNTTLKPTYLVQMIMNELPRKKCGSYRSSIIVFSTLPIFVPMKLKKLKTQTQTFLSELMINDLRNSYTPNHTQKPQYPSSFHLNTAHQNTPSNLA